MPSREADFRSYRKNLPHFRARGHLYFVTWRLSKRQADLTPEERSIVTEALRWFDGKRYDLWGYVVMNDHVHVLVLPEDSYPLESIMHSWKSFTAHRIGELSGRAGHLWQEESFDRVVRNEEELYQKLVYIKNNPMKRWPDVESYRWVWCKGEDSR